MRVTTRFKTPWLLFSIGFFGLGIFVIAWGDLSWPLKGLLEMSALFFFFLFALVIPTARVDLDSQGFSIRVGVGLPGRERLHIKNITLKWTQVVSVVSVFPRWWPLSWIIVLSFDGIRTHAFPLGTFITNTREALSIICGNVDHGKIDMDILETVPGNVHS